MDPIANMISTINNYILVKKDRLVIPYSKIKEEILKVLKENNYIEEFIINKLQNDKKNIKVILKYHNNTNSIHSLKRVSRPGLRIYRSYSNIPKVLGGIGDVIMSTPKGILSGKKARRQKVGGEIICEVY